MQHKLSLVHSFWFWFFGAIALYTTYDYFKHLAYPDSIFLEHAYQWLAFTIASMLTMCLIMFGIHRFLQKWTYTRHFMFDGIGVAIAMIVHITLTGPLWDRLIWTASDLNFFFRWQPLLILLGAFYGIRTLFYFLIQRKHITEPLSH
ncbi:hypothetical protein AB2B38_009060 [Balneola sp. MJW-20]|uniref:hypothetical protein n=1 Tax=Gracilimonas aurantiaca TaxID=3234185 RepID=UPI003467206C